MQSGKFTSEGVWFQRQYVDLLDGDIPASLMFSQIIYWNSPSKTGNSKLRVFSNGKRWLAKSAAHWNDELGFSQKQAHRCIKLIEKKGLIQTMIKKFDGSPTTHIALTDHGLTFAKGQLGFPKSPIEVNGFTLAGKSITEITPENTAKTTTYSAGEPADPILPLESQDNQMGENKSTVKVNSKMGKLWMELVPVHYPQYSKTLTKKELGQLKQIQTKVGERTLHLLEYVAQNWWRLIFKAQSDCGASSCPSVPDIAFLAKYFHLAIELMETAENEKAHQAAVKLAALKLATQKAVEPLTEAVLTEEQIQADLEYFANKAKAN